MYSNAHMYCACMYNDCFLQSNLGNGYYLTLVKKDDEEQGACAKQTTPAGAGAKPDIKPDAKPNIGAGADVIGDSNTDAKPEDVKVLCCLFSSRYYVYFSTPQNSNIYKC